MAGMRVYRYEIRFLIALAAAGWLRKSEQDPLIEKGGRASAVLPGMDRRAAADPLLAGIPSDLIRAGFSAIFFDRRELLFFKLEVFLSKTFWLLTAVIAVPLWGCEEVQTNGSPERADRVDASYAQAPIRGTPAQRVESAPPAPMPFPGGVPLCEDSADGERLITSSGSAAGNGPAAAEQLDPAPDILSAPPRFPSKPFDSSKVVEDGPCDPDPPADRDGVSSAPEGNSRHEPSRPTEEEAPCRSAPGCQGLLDGEDGLPFFTG